MQSEPTTSSASRWRTRPAAWIGLGLAVAVGALMIGASLAGAQLPLRSLAGSSNPSPFAPAVTGPLVPLGFNSETGSTIGGVLDPSAVVPLGQSDTIVVTLPVQDPGALTTFISSVSTPSSASYADFLTPQQFTSDFSPPLADQQAIADYLSSAGATEVYLTPDHLSITATATLQQLETIFGVTFAMYSKGTQTFFAPTASPSFPASLAPYVYGLAGLTDYSFGTHIDLLAMPHGVPNQAVAGTGVLDYPNQDLYEFQLNQLFNATGNQSAGVVPTYAQGVVVAPLLWSSGVPGWCGYSAADIGNFFSGTTGTAFNFPSDLPSPTDHANWNIPGDPGSPPGPAYCDTGGTSPNTASEELSLELTIDQEYSGDQAPGATIEPTYVNGTGPTVLNSDLEILLAYVASGGVPNLSVATQSFGGGESTNSSGSYEAVSEQDYEEMAAQGLTVLASSGDDNGASGSVCSDLGLPGGSGTTTMTPIVDYPGSSPNVLGIGGTANMGYGGPGSLTGGLNGQTVWNWCPSTNGGESAGSTGGVSSAFPETWWQANDPIVNAAMLNAITVTETGNGSANSPGGINDGIVYNSTTARPGPDLSGPAADLAGYFGQQWVSGWGGTSFSSPAIAGMLGSIVAFDGHKLGLFGPALYSLEQQYLNGQVPYAPTYYVQNYSNAFFNGAFDYNTSAGWGVPQAYNIARDLGKPFISTNPEGAAATGSPYPITARVTDVQPVKQVEVAYLAPGSTSWSTAALALASGTATYGTWTGSIPALPQAGALKYCVEAIDQGAGNSWTPYNQSAWGATGGTNVNFGCTVPWTVSVHQTYTATFSESGLVSGTAWSVTVSGAAHPTTATSLSVSLENGTYAYSVGTVAGYYPPSPAQGTLVIAGSGASVTVSFGRPSYALTFTETGLPSGTTWQLSVNGGAAVSTNGNTLAFQEPNGTYTYSIAGIAGWHITTGSYAGSVTLYGGGATIATTWTQVKYAVSFSESGLKSGTLWSVSVNAETISSKATTLDASLANGTYSYSAKAGGYTTVTGSVTVDGAQVTVSVVFHSAHGGSPSMAVLTSAAPAVATVRR